MQTFLPYPDFQVSAEVLDRARLGKQRAETKQILKALLLSKGWIHHPATKMWTDYEFQLAEYGIVICREWTRRGYEDNTLQYFFEVQESTFDTGLPPWFGNEEFHEAHRSKLMSKMPEHYYFPDTRLNLPYQWPVLTEDGYYLKQGK